MAHYEAEEYAAAAGAFAASFLTSGDFADLFAWAQSERLWGQCERAVELYSIFLSSEPPPPNRAAASRGIDRCGGRVELELTHPGILATERGRASLQRLIERGYALSGNPWFLFALAESKGAGERCGSGRELLERSATEAQSAVLAELARARLNACAASADASGTAGATGTGGEARGEVVGASPGAERAGHGELAPWYRDRWGGALAGGGFVVAAAGGVTLYLGHRRVERADGPTYGAFAADVDSGRRLETVGAIAIGAGAVLVALGLWRYASRERGVRVAPQVEGERVGLLLSTDF